MKILSGKTAKNTLNYLLGKFEGEGKYIECLACGYFKEDDYYVCFDNTSFSCFVEQTKSMTRAIKWCLGKIEADKL